MQNGASGHVSFSLETPETNLITPAGQVSSDQSSSNLPDGLGLQGALGGICTGSVAVAGTACGTNVLSGNPAKAGKPDLTAAWYIAQTLGQLKLRSVLRA